MQAVSLFDPVVATPSVSQPQGKQTTITFECSKPLGLGLAQKSDGTVIVSSVEETCWLFCSAGLSVGARVLEVNGESCTGKGKGAVLEMIKAGKAQASIALTFDAANNVEDHVSEAVTR